MNTVDKVIKVAEKEVGYLEKSRSAYLKDKNVLYDKTKGSGQDNYTKYGYEMHNVYPSVMDFPAYWCDAFVDWCFMTAYGVNNAKALLGGNFDDYTVASAQLYKNKNAYIKRGEKKPQVGDQIFFNNGTRICHTGIVYKVDANYVYTIEGNTSGGSTVVANGGGVAKKQYPLTYFRIDGYGRPKYDVAKPTPIKKGYQGTFPVIPPILKKGERGVQVARWQSFVNWYFGKTVLKVDSDFGDKTKEYTIKFQKELFSKDKSQWDGEVGKNTLAVAKTIKK